MCENGFEKLYTMEPDEEFLPMKFVFQYTDVMWVYCMLRYLPCEHRSQQLAI